MREQPQKPRDFNKLNSVELARDRRILTYKRRRAYADLIRVKTGRNDNLETKDSNLYKLVPKSRALPIKLVSNKGARSRRGKAQLDNLGYDLNET